VGSFLPTHSYTCNTQTQKRFVYICIYKCAGIKEMCLWDMNLCACAGGLGHAFCACVCLCVQRLNARLQHQHRPVSDSVCICLIHMKIKKQEQCGRMQFVYYMWTRIFWIGSRTNRVIFLDVRHTRWGTLKIIFSPLLSQTSPVSPTESYMVYGELMADDSTC